MSKVMKIVVITLAVVILSAAGIWYYAFVWSANHHRNVEDENGIPVTSAAIVAAFEADERHADSIYLDKAVQVTGEITSVQQNQQGKQTIAIKSDDPMSNVFCTMKNSDAALKQGTAITIKGICTGYLSDVVIIEAVLITNK